MVEPEEPPPAEEAHEQMALAAIRTDAASAEQAESTQPWAADWIARYAELEHWQAYSNWPQPTREAAELMQGTCRGSIELWKRGRNDLLRRLEWQLSGSRRQFVLEPKRQVRKQRLS